MSLNYYRVITGRFVIQSYQPDGDSVRFIADNPENFNDLYRGYKIRPSKKDGSVQLRLEGIDAPETHYGEAIQPFGDKARDLFLKQLGFTKIKYDNDNKTVASSSPKTVAGAIFSKAADPFGRPICYAAVGSRFEDGAMQPVDTATLKSTVNFRMVEAGGAYGLFYSSTPPGHRDAFREAATAARSADKGVWRYDQTPLFRLENQASIGPQGALIFPKLFRRCTDYLKAAQSSQVGYDLNDWLLENPSEDDELLIEIVCREGDKHRIAGLQLHNLIEQRNSRIAFQADTLAVVFIEK